MLGSQWYFQLTRKYIAIVGHLLNNISIERSDTSNNTTAVITVPVEYSPKENMMKRLLSDPNISRPYSDLVPRITFSLETFKYDGDRKFPSINYIAQKQANNSSRALYQYNPVAYDFQFKATVWVKNLEDGWKIMEQILPYFTPEYTVRANLVPEINETRDIPVILTATAMEDAWDNDFKNRQYIVWDLDLTLKGYVYGPVRSAPLILFVNATSYSYNPEASNTLPGEPVYKVLTQPGLTVTGQPTSNIAQSVPTNTIFYDSNYGIIVTQTDVQENANTETGH